MDHAMGQVKRLTKQKVHLESGRDLEADCLMSH